MTGKSHNYIPELWGGIECSYNRVGDQFFDQLELSNHYQRSEEDIGKIAELGIKKLRYPILWEYHQPYANTKIDWSWISQQLKLIQQNNITPIAGLLHHGSGPVFTNLYDEEFSKKFADYAYQVAKQFPSLEYYTPINEPLTTARFSGLYGLWYPHYKDDFSFATMFLNQLKGIVLAMKAIRKINPSAKLIQTEDLGKTYSTPLLQYQADFENERRWLTYDFLCGKVDQNHALWSYFIEAGIHKKTLMFFIDNPCPPDIVGLNHYLTSERFLDEKLKLYPSHMHGGNDKHAYADVEAIRVKHDKLHGLFWLVLEAWKRFDIKLALTEVHVHCTREEQLRWLKEKLDIGTLCANHGIPLQAVTAWSILGAYGWNKLLTGLPFTYEPGVFDLSGGQPRSTALANLLMHYSAGKSYNHPVLDQPAWWTRSDRYIVKDDREPVIFNSKARSLFILSNENNIFFAECIHHYCKQRGVLSHIIHLEDEKELETLMFAYNPWAIINANMMDEDDTIYSIYHASQLHHPHTNDKVRLVHFLPTWVDLADDFLNTLSNKPLLIRADLSGNPEFKKIENLFISDPSSLTSILSTFPYISEFIHTALDLLIDGCTGVWETSIFSAPPIHNFVQENIFD
jgi:dTDP-4-dehydrorhamnose reductase